MLLLSVATALAIPVEFGHSGRLFDATGLPIVGSHDLTVTLYDAAVGGSSVWTETQAVSFDNGYFHVELGAGASNTIETSDLTGSGLLYVELIVDSGTPGNRFPITSVPYSRISTWSETAESLAGGVVDASELRVNGTMVVDSSGAFYGGVTLDQLGCVADQVPFFNGADWSCAASGSGGGVSSWSDLAGIPAGFADDVDDDGLGALTCSDAQHPVWSALNARWECGVDRILTESEVEGFITNGPLALDPLTTIGGATLVTNWSNLPGIPSDLDDGDDDTQLTESEVDAFVANNGYAMASSLSAVGTSGDWGDLVGVPLELLDGDDDTQLSEAEVDAFVGNNGFALTSSLSAIATTGAYADLIGAPTLATVATSGAYADLSGTPSLALVATSGAYADLSGAPSLASVATSGAYADLTGTPSLATVATSGDYQDLTNKPGRNIVTNFLDVSANCCQGWKGQGNSWQETNSNFRTAFTKNQASSTVRVVLQENVGVNSGGHWCNIGVFVDVQDGNGFTQNYGPQPCALSVYHGYNHDHQMLECYLENLPAGDMTFTMFDRSQSCYYGNYPWGDNSGIRGFVVEELDQ